MSKAFIDVIIGEHSVHAGGSILGSGPPGGRGLERVASHGPYTCGYRCSDSGSRTDWLGDFEQVAYLLCLNSLAVKCKEKCH